MPDVLVLGASSESMHAMDIARDMGWRIVAMDGSPDAPGLEQADESVVVDIMNTDAVLERMGDRVPDAILPVPIGRALVATGHLNDLWGLKGVCGRAAGLCTDKYAFAKFLRSRGLRPSICCLAEEALADDSVVCGMRAPVVVKPRYGSGSRGVFLVETPEEALGLLGIGDIVEEALPGAEYGLDGLVVRGEPIVLMMRSKVNTPPPVCQCVGYQTLPREHPAYTIATPFVVAVVRAIGLSDGLFHADLMIDGDEIGVIELSCRPSGHGIYDRLLPLATGLDPVALFLSCCVGGETAPEPPRVDLLFMGFFDLGEGIVDSCPDPCMLAGKYDLAYYEQAFSPGDFMERTVDGTVTSRGRFILRGQGADVRERARRLLGEFRMARQ